MGAQRAADPLPQPAGGLTRASAPGKVILFGEHAGVHGQPALAAPVAQVRAVCTVEPAAEGVWIDARDTGQRYPLAEAQPDDPLAAAIHLTLAHLSAADSAVILPPSSLILESSIPIASGLGSGAAVCTALVRALAIRLRAPLADEQVSAIVFETEKLLHGTPSGIDNTVIAFGQPVYFVRGRPPEPFRAAQPFDLLIADTGLPSPTRVAVADVRAAHQAAPERYEAMFRAIGAIADRARAIIEGGRPAALGPLMDENHAWLREMEVSCAELEALADAARAAGALGAKLSGGGRGGNLIALVEKDGVAPVRAALEQAGAKRVIHTVIGQNPPKTTGA